MVSVHEENMHTLLQTLGEPLLVHHPCAILVSFEFTLKGVLHGDVSSILQSNHGTCNRTGLLACNVAGDVVGDCKDDEGM